MVTTYISIEIINRYFGQSKPLHEHFKVLKRFYVKVNVLFLVVSTNTVLLLVCQCDIFCQILGSSTINLKKFRVNGLIESRNESRNESRPPTLRFSGILPTLQRCQKVLLVPSDEEEKQRSMTRRPRKATSTRSSAKSCGRLTKALASRKPYQAYNKLIEAENRDSGRCSLSTPKSNLL